MLLGMEHHQVIDDKFFFHSQLPFCAHQAPSRGSLNVVNIKISPIAMIYEFSFLIKEIEGFLN